jgi:hypothetical protein
MAGKGCIYWLVQLSAPSVLLGTNVNTGAIVEITGIEKKGIASRRQVFS